MSLVDDTTRDAEAGKTKRVPDTTTLTQSLSSFPTCTLDNTVILQPLRVLLYTLVCTTVYSSTWYLVCTYSDVRMQYCSNAGKSGSGDERLFSCHRSLPLGRCRATSIRRGASTPPAEKHVYTHSYPRRNVTIKTAFLCRLYV